MMWRLGDGARETSSWQRGERWRGTRCQSTLALINLSSARSNGEYRHAFWGPYYLRAAPVWLSEVSSTFPRSPPRIYEWKKKRERKNTNFLTPHPHRFSTRPTYTPFPRACTPRPSHGNRTILFNSTKFICTSAPPRSSSFLSCPLVYRIFQSYPPSFFRVAYTIFLRFACMITSNKDCFCTHTIDYRTHHFNLIGHGGEGWEFGQEINSIF